MLNSLERIIPDYIDKNEVTSKQSLSLHLERYQFAGSHLIEGTTLDFACGAGYGSYIVATEFLTTSKIIGADGDEAIIDYARKRYQHPNIEFINTDDQHLHNLVPYLKNIICLETIEHLKNPEYFIRDMSDKLEKGGRFIASVPVTASMDANPYHLHDFTIEKFRNLFIVNNYRELDTLLQVQPYSAFTILGRQEIRMKTMRKNIIGYYFSHPSKLLLRLTSLFKNGFTNKYYTGVFEKL